MRLKDDNLNQGNNFSWGINLTGRLSLYIPHMVAKTTSWPARYSSSHSPFTRSASRYVYPCIDLSLSADHSRNTRTYLSRYYNRHPFGNTNPNAHPYVILPEHPNPPAAILQPASLRELRELREHCPNMTNFLSRGGPSDQPTSGHSPSQ